MFDCLTLGVLLFAALMIGAFTIIMLVSLVHEHRHFDDVYSDDKHSNSNKL